MGNLTIQELEKRGIAKPNENLSEVQKSINHLATVTIENHTAIAGFHWRYGYNMPEFFEKLCRPYFYEVPSAGRGMAFFRYLATSYDDFEEQNAWYWKAFFI